MSGEVCIGALRLHNLAVRSGSGTSSNLKKSGVRRLVGTFPAFTIFLPPQVVLNIASIQKKVLALKITIDISQKRYIFFYEKQIQSKNESFSSMITTLGSFENLR
jgi:hypothetical protein